MASVLLLGMCQISDITARGLLYCRIDVTSAAVCLPYRTMDSHLCASASCACARRGTNLCTWTGISPYHKLIARRFLPLTSNFCVLIGSNFLYVGQDTDSDTRRVLLRSYKPSWKCHTAYNSGAPERRHSL